jgi:hypothetical protein
MTSNVDATVPVFGAPTTASVRQNFLIIKDEISALQLAQQGVASGRATPINVVGSGAVVLPLQADVSIYVNNGTATPITVTLPNGNVNDQRVLIKDTGGNAGNYNISVSTATGIDSNNPYVIASNYASLSVVWNGSTWGTI